MNPGGQEADHKSGDPKATRKEKLAKAIKRIAGRNHVAIPNRVFTTEVSKMVVVDPETMVYDENGYP